MCTPPLPLNPHSRPLGTSITSPVLQMRTLRFGGIKYLPKFTQLLSGELGSESGSV